MENKQPDEITGQEVVLFLIRFVMAALLTFPASGLVCVALDRFELRAVDFLCGHNVFIQLPVLLIILIVGLGWIPPFNKYKRSKLKT